MKPLANSTAVASAPVPVTAEVIWERLWCALPSVQASERDRAICDPVLPAVQRQTKEKNRSESPNDVHKSSEDWPSSSVVLPSSEMEKLVTCVFLFLHANPVEADTQAAVQQALTKISSQGNTSAAMTAPQKAFTKNDVVAFLNSVPSLWATVMVEAQADEVDRKLWIDFNTELVDCLVNDEAPCNLLEPDEVLTVQRTMAPIYLEAPLRDYIEVLPPRSYPVVYDTLFTKLQLDDRESENLTLPQFRLFFGWFFGLHFRNTNAPRSDMAAEGMYNRYRDEQGRLTVRQFQRACEELCAVYVQRRDAAAYLQHLVTRTEQALSKCNLASEMSVDFFLHPGEVTLPSWRRSLQDPVALYLPDELRVVQQEADRCHRHSSPRILLLGPTAIGKSDIGRRLAQELHCVHLDVVELAVAAARHSAQSELSERLRDCLARQEAISVGLQVQLLQEAMRSARVEYHGYVFSDTCSSTAATLEAFNEYFVQPLRLSETSRPDYVVEVCTADAEIYREYALPRIAAAATASKKAWDAFLKEESKKTRETEKAQMKFDCDKIIAHLAELEGLTGKAAPPAAEMELARQRAAEAIGILDTLGVEDEQDAAAEDNKEADDREEPTSPMSEAEKRKRELRLRVAELIAQGRAQAGLRAAVEGCGADDVCVSSDVVPALHDQDWAGSWRKHIEAAKSLQRHAMIDPIASASVEEVTAYIARVFQLFPCDEARVLRPKTTEGDMDDADGYGSLDPPTSLVEDEERCRMVEDAAQEAGLSQSPIWKSFCPVTALEDQVLIEGAACYACTYRGCYYCFASARKRAMFMDYPVKYLRQGCPGFKPVLMLAEDSLTHSVAAVEALQEVFEEVATSLNLTPYTLATYAQLLVSRQNLLNARREIHSQRHKAVEERRAARLERQELAAKAQTKKGKGKIEPSKPKQNKQRGSVGRPSLVQQLTQQHPSGSADAAARPLAALAMKLEVPQSMADEKAAQIREAKKKAARTAPLLLSALTPEDLQLDLLRSLWHDNLLPERVVVLRTTVASSASAEDESEKRELKQAAEEALDSASPKHTSSVLEEVLELLKGGPKSDWRSVMASGDSAVSASPKAYEIHTVSFVGSPIVAEVVAEVTQRLNPLSIEISEATVDEALGEEDENEVDEEAEEEEEEAAILNPDGDAPPAMPRPTRHPLVRAGRRFLHQFGSRLNYCPVTLYDRGILVRGRPEFCLRYQDGLHVFATQDARDAFARCPQRYVGELPPENLPPRLWLIGSSCTGKKTLAAGLQETYRVPYFAYDRHFFEECVEAALTPGGAMVQGVYIPPDSEEANPYLRRAHTLLDELRTKSKEEKMKLKARAEAERLLREHGEREEERAARDSMGSDEEESAAEDDWNEEKEAELQAKLEFEPEDPEEKQARLNEACLRIASCVTRFRPFDTQGYIMICPPFTATDLDVLFDEGGIPELALRLSIEEDTYADRSASRITQSKAETKLPTSREAMLQGEKGSQIAKQVETRRQASERRRREKALRKWRRRHIGVNDVDSPSDVEEDAVERAQDKDEPKGATTDNDAYSDAEDDAAWNDKFGLNEDRHAQEEALDELVGGLEERLVEVLRVDSSAAKETVRSLAIEALGRHMRYRASLFYVPEVKRYEEAQASLANGGGDLSSFGYVDPVRLYEYRYEGRRAVCSWKPPGIRVGPERTGEEQSHYLSENAADNGANEAEEPEELSEVISDDVQELRNVVERRKKRLRSENAPRVARVNHRLFFFENDESLLRFVRDPWPFMRQPPPNPTLLQQPVISVFDRDTRYATEISGHKERSLADSVAFSLHVKCISAPTLLAWGAVHPNWHALKLDCVLAALRGTADATLIQRLLILYLSTAEVKRHGAVLHNLPISAESVHALPKAACTAPIVKVMSTMSSSDDGALSSAVVSCEEGVSNGWGEAMGALERYASVHFALPRPSVPLDSSNLIAAVHGVEEFVLEAEESVLRERRAFPAPLHEGYSVFDYVHRHLSEYGAYCPYEWMEHDDLVRTLQPPNPENSVPNMEPRPASPSRQIDLRWGVRYLQQYFFFSSEEYVERFLMDPTTVTEPTTAKPMPKHCPAVLPPSTAETPIDESALALEGCCPVLLYDTRERRGLRSVVQPVAKKGSLDVVVEYDGKLYALLNRENMSRFVRRPWQYVGGAHLPSVLRRPLPTGMTPSAIADHEEYIQRQVYDPLAEALLAVAFHRPVYPGLSAEESALKFIALFLKAHRDPANITDFETKTYKQHFQLYLERATFYKGSTADGRESADSGRTAGTAAMRSEAEAAADRHFCAAVQASLQDAQNMKPFNRLPHPAESS